MNWGMIIGGATVLYLFVTLVGGVIVSGNASATGDGREGGGIWGLLLFAPLILFLVGLVLAIPACAIWALVDGLTGGTSFARFFGG